LINNKYINLLLILIIAAFIASCGKKEISEKSGDVPVRGPFVWTDKIDASKIPDFPVKGMISGNEVKIEYVNFEYWRGSNDNVINFFDMKPQQDCGAVTGGKGFVFTKYGGDLKEDAYIKEDFKKSMDKYETEYHYYEGDNIKSFKSTFNFALVIEDINDDFVEGRIAVCFNDESKSWVAGRFRAIVCNN